MEYYKMKIIILFDGPSSSGKTTYSKALYNKYKNHCDLIEFDKIYKKEKKKNIDKIIINKINNSKYDIIILDMYISFKHIIQKFIPNIVIYTVLIYTNLKDITKFVNKRKEPRRTTDILLHWSLLFSKTTKTDKKYIDTIYKKDINNLINNNKYEQLNETEKTKLFNKIIKEFKFGYKTNIYIKPNNDYDLIIKTKKISINKSPKFINDNLNIFIRPNLNLIRDHGVIKTGNSKSYNDWKNKYNIKKPCCVVFQKNNKTLYYIGTAHTTDKFSKTFKLIRNIHKINFDLVISEGFKFNDGINNDKYIKKLLNKNISEQEYNSLLGYKNNIDFCGIEPEFEDILKSLKKYINNGDYKIEDLYGYQYLLLIPQLKRAKLNDKEINKVINKRINKIKKIYKQKIDFNINKWYYKNFNRNINYNLITNNDTAPIKTGSITQMISVDIDELRETEIINNLFYYIQRYNRIVITYGFNHLYADFKTLVNFFGKPKKIIKL